MPCIYDGPLLEFLHHEGLLGILNQMTVWLERAALAQLIDPEQGWEPVRRDALDDYVVADAAILRSLVQRDGGWSFLKFEYLRFLEAGATTMAHGEIGSTPLKINSILVRDIFNERPLGSDGRLAHGRSAALIAWPGKLPSGELVVTRQYTPETVTDVDGLMARARLYGCDQQLQTALTLLKGSFASYQPVGPFLMAIVLCARRPTRLISTDSAIELCPYVVDVAPPSLFGQGGKSVVRPAGHRHAISPGLLRHMAGEPSAARDELLRWTLIGCGSLGSKIALHLARSGRAPTVVIDKSTMSPHNAARHSLIPQAGDLQILWMESKAKLLADAIRSFGQEAVALPTNAIDLVASADAAKTAWSKKTWAVVNATASLPAREALAAASLRRLPARVIETSLYSGGRLGVITVEGPDRNPNTGDLMAATYALLKADPAMSRLAFSRDGATGRCDIGEGCGSLPMPMSDARLSLLAAPMAERIAQLQRSSLSQEDGEILIGQLGDDGLSLSWQRHSVPPLTVVHTENGSSWHVRIHARAVEKITAEVRAWPTVETGGILVGRISEVLQSLQVVDVLPAPQDSSRSTFEFILGVQDVRSTLAAYAEESGWSLYCLGTWHSHLGPSGPSATDRATAKAAALARIAPSVLLIHTPTGFRALLDEDSDR